MKKTFKLMLAATAAAALVACGGGGGSSTPMEMVATTNLATPLTAEKIGAISGVPFAFPTGVPAFGIASALSVTLNPTTFHIETLPAGSGKAADGSIVYGTGTCTVDSSASTFPGTPLDQDYGAYTVSCSLLVGTNGTNAQGIAVLRPVTLVLGGQPSTPTNLSTKVMPSGDVFVREVYVGTVPVGAMPVTGASGASGGFF